MILNIVNYVVSAKLPRVDFDLLEQCKKGRYKYNTRFGVFSVTNKYNGLFFTKSYNLFLKLKTIIENLLDIRIEDYKICNIVGNYKLNKYINLWYLSGLFDNYSYNPELFPAFFCELGSTTFGIFRTGTINFFGKNEEKIKKDLDELIYLIESALI